jgi:hypothetical protein
MKALEPGMVIRFPEKLECLNGKIAVEITRHGKEPSMELISVRTLKRDPKRYTKCNAILDQDGDVVAHEFIYKTSECIGNKVFTKCEIIVLPTHTGLIKTLLRNSPVKIIHLNK